MAGRRPKKRENIVSEAANGRHFMCFHVIPRGCCKNKEAGDELPPAPSYDGATPTKKIYRGLGRKGRAVSERGLMRRRGPIGGGTACKE
jgi:hypothetical protein